MSDDDGVFFFRDANGTFLSVAQIFSNLSKFERIDRKRWHKACLRINQDCRRANRELRKQGVDPEALP